MEIKIDELKKEDEVKKSKIFLTNLWRIHTNPHNICSYADFLYKKEDYQSPLSHIFNCVLIHLFGG